VKVLCASAQSATASGFRYGRLLTEQFLFEYILNIALVRELPPPERVRAERLFEETLPVLNLSREFIPVCMRMVLKILPVRPVAELLRMAKIVRRTLKKGLLNAAP
jgi:hypothetical protein